MSLPDGVTTCLVTYGPITDTFGNPADSITVEVVADRTIVHAASGRTLFKNPVSVTADSGGIAQIPVPHTNQFGFRDQQQNALTGWYYIVRLTARFGTAIQTDSKTFQPLVGQTTVDADLLSSSGMVTPGVTTPTGIVTSIAGQTGAVGAHVLADALSVEFATIGFDVGVTVDEDANEVVQIVLANLAGVARGYVTGYVVVSGVGDGLDTPVDLVMIGLNAALGDDGNGNGIVRLPDGYVVTRLAGSDLIFGDFEGGGELQVLGGNLTVDVPLSPASYDGFSLTAVHVFGNVSASRTVPDPS